MRVRLPFELFDPKLRRNVWRYLLQCALATAALVVVLSAQDALARLVVVAAIGSTAFVLLITPHSDMASPRHVLGGHAVAIVIGSIAALFDATGTFTFALQGSLAVGATMFVMAGTNTEHAPAAGTALGIVGAGFSWGLILFVVSGIVVLVAIHLLLRSRLENLY